MFDEATNALDANNESIIMNNLSDFFKNKYNCQNEKRVMPKRKV
jgi:ABC-type transport system involved in Fe-S cluster assembly fused permease/ATPase subunit